MVASDRGTKLEILVRYDDVLLRISAADRHGLAYGTRSA